MFIFYIHYAHILSFLLCTNILSFSIYVICCTTLRNAARDEHRIRLFVTRGFAYPTSLGAPERIPPVGRYIYIYIYTYIYIYIYMYRERDMHAHHLRIGGFPGVPAHGAARVDVGSRPSSDGPWSTCPPRVRKHPQPLISKSY